MIYFSLAIGLVMIIFLSYATSELWRKYINTKTISGFLFPGTIVHELSHALICLSTGTTIKELNLFSSNNTGIKYDKPKVPFVFDFIIASAPIFACAALIFLIAKLLSNPIHLNNTFPHEIHFSLKGLFDLIRHLLDAAWVTLNAFWNQLHLGNIHHVLFLLAIIIFTVSMSPHRQDIKPLVIGFAVLSIILFFIEKAGVDLLKYWWWSYCIKELWVIIPLTISVLSTLLFVTLLIMGFVKGFRLTFGHKSSSK